MSFFRSLPKAHDHRRGQRSTGKQRALPSGSAASSSLQRLHYRCCCNRPPVDLKGFLKTSHSDTKLENLKKRKDELEEEIGGYMSLDAYTEQLCKEDEAYRTTERMQREREEELQKREEVKRLREEYVRLQDKKAELHRQVERDAVYQKYMERAVKMTKFKDVPQLISNFERLLRFEELHQRDAESAQKVEENKRTVAALKDQHNLVWLQRNNEMYPLPAELAKERSKSVTWERRWAHIKQTAAKKTLLMGQIKMAAFNLYDMRSGAEDGEEAVDMCDTETQLEEVQNLPVLLGPPSTGPGAPSSYPPCLLTSR
uniref:DUF4200 domain-containing protein n=1 Tax=Labrus bergylta TaxID=56723 RepID=A0A3Q3F036_9LABR